MVKDYSDSEKRNQLPSLDGLFFPIPVWDGAYKSTLAANQKE